MSTTQFGNCTCGISTVLELSGRSVPGVASQPGTSTIQSVIRFEMRSWEWSGPLPLFLPRPVVRGRGLSAHRSVDGLAHVGQTSLPRRSLSGSTVAQALGHAPGTGTSVFRSTVRCSTRSCGMALRDLQETRVSFVCEKQPCWCSQ